MDASELSEPHPERKKYVILSLAVVSRGLEGYSFWGVFIEQVKRVHDRLVRGYQHERPHLNRKTCSKTKGITVHIYLAKRAL